MNKRNAVKTSASIIVGKILIRLMDLGVLMVLARILTPSDFGVIAMARTSLFIIEAITELPIVSALIREDQVSDEMLDTALTLGILRGFAITIGMAALAHPISQLYNEPRLSSIMIAISIAPFFRGIQSPKNIIYIKKMDFRRLIAQELIGKIGAVSLCFGYATAHKDYWALAILTITAPIISAITSFIFAPMRIKPTLKEWHIFKDIIGWNFLSQLMASLNWQLERLVLPRYIDKSTFGQYTSFAELIDVPIKTILLPLSNQLDVKFKNAEISSELKEKYLQIQGLIFIFLAPIFTYAALFPKPIILIFLGEKWLNHSYVFGLLAIGSIIYLPTTCIASLASNLYQNRLLTLRTFLEFCVSLPLVLVLTYLYGLNGAIAGRLCTTTFVLLISVNLGKKLIDISRRAQFFALICPATCLLLSCLLTKIIFQNISFQKEIASLTLYLFLTCTVFFGLYFLILLLICIVFKKRSGAEALIRQMIFFKFKNNSIKD